LSVDDDEKTLCKERPQVDDESPKDTFLNYGNSGGWQHGVVFINGFNIGRYNSAGPQLALYIPGPLLKQGKNEVKPTSQERTEKWEREGARERERERERKI
jgi:hypothetical protein